MLRCQCFSHVNRIAGIVVVVHKLPRDKLGIIKLSK